MHQHQGRPGSRRAGGLIATVALVAFAIYLTHAALDIAERATETLLNFHQFFHTTVSVSLAAIIAGALFAAIVYGVAWLHAEALLSCLKSILRSRVFTHLSESRGTYGRFIGSVLFAACIVGIVFVPPRSKPLTAPLAPLPALAAPADPVEKQEPMRFADRSPLGSPTNEPSWPPLAMALLPWPTPDSNVCDLGSSFSLEQLSACEMDIKKHPNRKGTGGKVYILKKRATGWVIEPLPMPPMPPMPRPRPPLDILPMR